MTFEDLKPAPVDLDTMAERAGIAEEFLRSLASRHRLMILCTLLDSEMSVGDLARRLGLSQPNLSRHLALLREEQIVATRRDGKAIYYRVISERVLPVIRVLYELFCVPSPEITK